jgi:hypothetical protein
MGVAKVPHFEKGMFSNIVNYLASSVIYSKSV